MTAVPPQNTGDSLDLLGLPDSALADHLDQIGIGSHHTHRVFRALQGAGQALDEDFQFGWRNLARLRESGHWIRPELVKTLDADDGTRKALIRLRDGAQIEMVLIPGSGTRTTLCLSSQVGCGIGCTFCATAQMGLRRNLGAGEIVGQFHAADELLKPSGRRVSHVVFMGMGEPMHNYDAVHDAIQILTDRRGPCLEARRITVSTVGLIKPMVQFGKDFGGRVQLALSLHAGTDETRAEIIPLARNYPLEALRRACLAHPLPGSRRLMIEYVHLPGLNDTEEELQAVARWTRDLKCLVNIVPFNPFPGTPHTSPSLEATQRILNRLRELGVPSTIRRPKGRLANAACGQLALTE